jgi:restriction system protein
MAIWLIRAGGYGEYEQKFIQENRVYVTWDKLATDLSKLKNRTELFNALAGIYENAKPKKLHNWVSQIWPFAHEIKTGDLVILPLKAQRAIQIGEITGDYNFVSKGPNPFYHWRQVKWIGENIPRSHFGQDLLNTFGAFMTICRVKRNNAEARIAAMRASGWKPETNAGVLTDADASDVEIIAGEETSSFDLEEQARDQIARLIKAKFKNHALARLVDAILRAQGYTTYLSPEGSDGGADILAGMGTLGFGTPQLCVEVKSGDTPIDRPTVDKLLGAMSKFGAQQGLFVSWSGFKTNVQKELAQSFFRVRLWSQKELLEALFST